MNTTQPSPVEQPVDLFAGLSKADVARLRSRLREERVPAGRTFIRCGDIGDCLYIIRAGTAHVRRGGRTVDEVEAGHVVGEMALLDSEPRNADVTAVTDCVLERLAAEDFSELCGRVPAVRLVLTRLVAHRLNWSGTEMLARRIGKYRVMSQLGAGNMGWVFRARPSRGKEVALKMLPHPLAAEPGFIERFRREAKLLTKVRHRNIVSLIDTIQLYGTMFLVMEFVRGCNVREWVVLRGSPRADDARCVARSVANAIQAAHARGIVHRDVKPDNVMVGIDGVVKLMDFGIATSLEDSPEKGTVALTPAYAAPEQFTNANVGPAADFYSLGVMIYELVAGQLPFAEESLGDWARAHMEMVPESLQEVCPTAPPDLSDFVNAALIKTPALRWRALQPILDRWRSESPPAKISVRPRSHARRSRPHQQRMPAMCSTILSF